MNQSLEIRKVDLDFGEKHIDVLVDFQIRLAKETEDFDLEPSKVREGIRRVLHDDNLGVYYVAIDKKEKIYGMLLTIKEWSDWRCAHVLWIHSLYVIRNERRLGIFKGFYQFLQDRVHSEPELAGIRLYVDKSNTQAIQVYRSMQMDDSHYKLFEWLKA